MLVTPDTFGSVLQAVARAPEVFYDLETDGLRPYQGNRLFGVALETPGFGPVYLPFRHRQGENLPELARACLLDSLAHARRLVGFNSIRFDSPMIGVEAQYLGLKMLEIGGPLQQDVILDALLANENEPSFSLDSLGKKYLGGAQKAAAQTEMMSSLRALHPRLRSKRALMGHLSELTPEQVAPYACADVSDTRALRDVYAPCLQSWGLQGLAEEMYQYARLLARVERRGLLIDQELCQERERKCLEEQAVVLGRIHEAAPDLNPASPAQVSRHLGLPSAGRQEVTASNHPLAPDIILYRQLGKMASTYYRGMLGLVDSEGVIHPQMNISRDPRDMGGTRSGRLSCSNPNFQNLPKRDPSWWMRVRDCVVARPGHKLIALDYQRAEMWLAGHYSGDSSLAEAYHAGRDLYSELAERAGCSRQQGKIDWLAIQYGAGPGKLSSMHDWPFKYVEDLAREFGRPVEEWGDSEWSVYRAQQGVRVRDSLFELCPGIKWKMKELIDKADSVGSIRLWTGRAIHFDGKYTHSFTAWNRLIQGGVGEMVRLAMQRLEEPLEKYGAEMVLQVHDELVIEAPEESALQVARVAKRVMEDFDFSLRPRVDVSWGQRFGQLEGVEV